MKNYYLFLLFFTFSFQSYWAQNDAALRFDGINDYVQTDYEGISADNSRTVEAWIKLVLDSNQRFIVDMGSLSSGAGGRFSLKLNQSANNIRIEIGGGGINGSVNVIDDQWHHVAVTYDKNAPNNKYKLYVDGVLDTQGDISTALNTPNTIDDVVIGARTDLSTSTMYDGTIDEVRIWDVARTATEIQNNMDKILCPQNNLKAYFQFDNGVPAGTNTSITNTVDSSGNNYTGTLNGFALTGGDSNFVAGATVTSTIDDTVTLNGNTLTATQTGATYQWIDCTNSTPISGETNQTFTASATGSYAVEITLSGCTVTSTCMMVTVATCTPVSTPYFEDFSNGDPACWATENLDSTTPVWAYNNTEDIDGDGTNDPIMGLIPTGGGDTSQDDWVFTEGIQLIGGLTYTIEVKYNTFDIAVFTSNASFDLAILDQQTSGTTNITNLNSYNNITEQGSLGDNTGNDLETQAYTALETFTAPTNGVYYVGIHGNATGGINPLLIFDVAVYEACVDPSVLTVNNISYNTSDVTWTENGSATEWNILYGPTGFDINTQGTLVNDTNTLGETLSNLDQDTAYDVYIQSVCSTTSTSQWVGPVTFTTLSCQDPSGITITNITTDSADVSWTENGTATEWNILYGISGFDVNTEGTLINDTDTLGETLINLSDDTIYDVYVQSICSTTATSEWTGPETFTTDMLNITSENFKGFVYYPNPVQNELNLSSKLEIEEIIVFNLMGQQVLTQNPNQLNTTLNLSQLRTGTYFMQVQIDGTNKTFQIIKN